MKNPEAVSLPVLTEEIDDEALEQPTIVLDVSTLEASLPTSNSGVIQEARRLPDELRGMYYHG